MGLKVSTISRLPLDTDRAYFVYFLDYGWSDDFSEKLYDNFDVLATGLSGHKGVVIAGLHRQEFADEVLSWHALNGEPADDLLPAILISICHPEEFRSGFESGRPWADELSGIRKHDGAILLPLRRICQTPNDVVPVISSVLRSIQQEKKIKDFEVLRMEKGKKHPSDMLVLRPSIAGMGVDLKEIWNFSKPYLTRRRPQDDQQG